MKRFVGVFITFAAVLGVATGPALAETKATKIEVQSVVAAPNGDLLVSGELSSAPRCEANRSMRLVYVLDGSREIVGTSKSRKNGSWRLRGPGATIVSDIRVRANPKRLGRRTRCAAAETTALIN